jgi:hypothetical protein
MIDCSDLTALTIVILTIIAVSIALGGCSHYATVTCDDKGMTVSSGTAIVVTPVPAPAPTGSVIIAPSVAPSRVPLVPAPGEVFKN